MRFYYRKSVNLGPFRVHLSKSGVGYSVGGRGLRVGTTPRGHKYKPFSIADAGHLFLLTEIMPAFISAL